MLLLPPRTCCVNLGAFDPRTVIPFRGGQSETFLHLSRVCDLCPPLSSAQAKQWGGVPEGGSGLR